MVPDLLERGVNFDIYSIDGVASVDTFLRYETLADDLRRFLQGLGIENGPELPCVKSSGRAVSWRDFYDDDTWQAGRPSQQARTRVVRLRLRRLDRLLAAKR